MNQTLNRSYTKYCNGNKEREVDDLIMPVFA
jgi:hypothetical protein